MVGVYPFCIGFVAVLVYEQRIKRLVQVLYKRRRMFKCQCEDLREILPIVRELTVIIANVFTIPCRLLIRFTYMNCHVAQQHWPLVCFVFKYELFL